MILQKVSVSEDETEQKRTQKDVAKMSDNNQLQLFAHWRIICRVLRYTIAYLMQSKKRRKTIHLGFIKPESFSNSEPLNSKFSD